MISFENCIDGAKLLAERRSLVDRSAMIDMYSTISLNLATHYDRVDRTFSAPLTDDHAKLITDYAHARIAQIDRELIALGIEPPPPNRAAASVQADAGRQAAPRGDGPSVSEDQPS